MYTIRRMEIEVRVQWSGEQDDEWQLELSNSKIIPPSYKLTLSTRRFAPRPIMLARCPLPSPFPPSISQCDTQYKSRNIRGFCHLYDGQEAIATGINDVFTQSDSWITSYRCHAIALIRGGSVKRVLAELYGKQQGYTKGKGGSMHFYNKEHGFFGGQGIVGAQVPVGVGLAFEAKYNKKEVRRANEGGREGGREFCCSYDGNIPHSTRLYYMRPFKTAIGCND